MFSLKYLKFTKFKVRHYNRYLEDPDIQLTKKENKMMRRNKKQQERLIGS
jgi:hypothetical protein